MGLYLIADLSDWNLLATLWTFARAAFALGVVIFVHELGHFAVAKWCGVKCEKFYLGFDIYGLKLAKFRWGETEYGIGILPLGGYVKMLGQDDNPARAADERRRSQIPIGTDVVGSEMAPDSGPAYKLDPRSYMAQSVPKRMAIISAGVIMNVIFALLAATVAYTIGVKDIACTIGEVMPGEAAWQAGIRGGDRVVQIGDEATEYPLRYRDLMHAVVLGDLNEGVKFKLERPGVDQPFWVTAYPASGDERKRLAPTIGVVPGLTTHLSSVKPVAPGSPAAATDEFKPGDEIIEVNGNQVKDYTDIEAALVRHVNEPLTVVVQRAPVDEAASKATEPERATIEIPANPMRNLGLVMKIGKITAVQDGSPAAEAAVRAGDFIKKINGQEVGNPMTLPERLQKGEFGQTVTLELTRNDEQKTETVQMDLREVTWHESPGLPGNSVSLPGLGIAYRVLNVVDQAISDGPVAQAVFRKSEKDRDGVKIQPGDEIVEAELLFPEKPPEGWDEDNVDWPPDIKPNPIKFSGDEPNWPFFIQRLQDLPEGTKVRLSLKGADGTAGPSAVITPERAKDWFNPTRGLILHPIEVTSKAENASMAVAMATRETKDSLGQVYAFLRRIGGQQVSIKALGGPVTIFQQAGGAADHGFATLLIFLTMLSANLAVINFLPIPLLDGGHMVFLALEGIFRKPVSERVIVAFHYLGFVFILTLMIFVLGLDLGIISRHG